MREFLRRSGWVFLAVIFIVSSVGIVIASFAISDNQDPAATQDQAQACSIEQTVTQETLTEPEPFKPSGDVAKLETVDVQPGSGKTVETGDCITVKYHGTLASNGTKFDGNFDQPIALKMRIGVGQVIPGWDKGLIGMKEGGIRRLIIPSELAYGSAQQSTIPANSDLVFEVKVLEAKKP